MGFSFLSEMSSTNDSRKKINRKLFSDHEQPSDFNPNKLAQDIGNISRIMSTRLRPDRGSSHEQSIHTKYADLKSKYIKAINQLKLLQGTKQFQSQVKEYELKVRELKDE